MKNRGKSINLYLMDGDASGRIKCTLANWTGVAYKIPRTDLDKCKEREDLKQSGVYFLFGTSDETGKNIVYIGQAGARKNGEGILNRLYEHKRNPEKDYWTEPIVFTTSNNSFGPTEISYLENRFCNLALSVNRYEVKNGNDPTPGNITEEKESEMEEFIDYAKIITNSPTRYRKNRRNNACIFTGETSIFGTNHKEYWKSKSNGLSNIRWICSDEGESDIHKRCGFDSENSKRKKRKSKYYWWNFAGRYSSFQSELCGFFCHWAKL